MDRAPNGADPNSGGARGQLITAIERLEVSTKPDVVADWLNRSIPMLDGRTPLATIATGDYERVAAIAEDFICPTFT